MRIVSHSRATIVSDSRDNRNEMNYIPAYSYPYSAILEVSHTPSSPHMSPDPVSHRKKINHTKVLHEIMRYFHVVRKLG
jgi:hypothetical protein